MAAYQAGQRDVPNASRNLAFEVANGSSVGKTAPRFLFVSGAGTVEANGLYKHAGRRWLGCEVLQNDDNDCTVDPQKDLVFPKKVNYLLQE